MKGSEKALLAPNRLKRRPEAFLTVPAAEGVMMMHHNNHKNMIPAAAGIAAVTLAAGAAAYAMNARSMKSSRKAMKRTAGKAARAMGEMVNTVVDSVASNVLG